MAAAMVGHIGISPGAVFAGRFEVRRLLAKGGMGSVYVARDRATDVDVAVKVLLPDLVSDDRMRVRFEREAKVAAEIDSPYVPKVHDAGIDRDGVPWIAMDLLDGRDLRRHVEAEGALSVAEAREILEQVAHALTAAHRRGLVHRDLKPENVFLHEAGGVRSVKLLDFGVVKVIDANKTSATGTGAVGSPLWMAPEQTSAGGRIAPATDIWALGLLSYYLLTGGYYWKAATDDSGVAGLLREMHIDPIERPSNRAAQLGVTVRFPAGYDEWFLRAMLRDSTARFKEAGAAWEALAPVLAAAPGEDAGAVGRDTGALGEPSRPSAEVDGDTVIDRGVGEGAHGGTLQSLGGRTSDALPPSPFAASAEDAATLAAPGAPVSSPDVEPPGVASPSGGVAWGAPPVAWAEAAPRPSAPSPEPAAAAWRPSPDEPPPPPPSPDRTPLPSWRPPPSAPPEPSVPSARTAPPPAPPQGSRWPWIIGLIVVGLAMSMLTGLIVWIVLTVTDPSPRRHPRPTPTPPPVGALASPSHAA